MTVTATDPWGLSGGDATDSAETQEVTITINDVNEAPSITGGATKARVAENNPIATAVSTYTAYPEVSTRCAAETCTWSLTGTDAGDFEVSTEAGNGSNLTFKKIPNYEMPADDDGDNVYEVTVKVTDSGTPKMSATRDVMVTVINADDVGKITFSSVQPRVRIPFTAILTDDDVVVGDVKWRWYTGDPDLQ